MISFFLAYFTICLISALVFVMHKRSATKDVKLARVLTQEMMNDIRRKNHYR